MKALAAHIVSLMPELTDVMNEWPEANESLEYPVLSMIQGNPQYSNMIPEFVSKTDLDAEKKTVSKWVVGMWDWKVQLDLWCGNKEERSTLSEKLFDIMNPDTVHADGVKNGLRLQLSNYHDVWVEFDISDQKVEDDEIGSQRREWRMQFTLLGNVNRIIERTDYGMETIENNVSIVDNIPSS
jgi:hypothetical protein